MEFKSFPSVVKEVQGRTVTGIASSFGVIDDYGDIMHRGSFKKTIQEGRSRIRHLWQHDMKNPPVAKITGIREVGFDDLPDVLKDVPGIKGGLEVSREYHRNQRAEEVFENVLTGAINEMSFGFDPVKSDFGTVEIDGVKLNVRNVREVILYDTSDVNWGANRHTAASKSIIPFKNTGYVKTLDETWQEPVLSDFTDGAWDDLSGAEKDRIAAHYAYRGGEDSFDSLKFAHHVPSRTGVGEVVWNGVKAAMACLHSVRIVEKDIEQVYNHLTSHYEHWSKTAPPLQWYALSRSLKDVLETPGLHDDQYLIEQLLHKVDLRLTQAEPGSTPLTSELERRLIEVRLTSQKREVRNLWTHEQNSSGKLTPP